MIVGHAQEGGETLPETAPALALLPIGVELLGKSIAVPALGLGSPAFDPWTVRCLVDVSALLLPMCGLVAPGRGLLTATMTDEYALALGAVATIALAIDWSRDHSPSDRSRSGMRSWQHERSRCDHVEAVAASSDRGNSGSMVEPAPAVAGGSSALPTSSLPDLVRLDLSLPGTVEQRGAVLGSFLLAAAVSGAGGVSAPTAPVPSAASVACFSTVPTPGASTPAGAASATASPCRCERAQGSSSPEKRRRLSSGQERSCSGGKRSGGRSPSPARSARSASVSASSSSESSDSEVRASAMPPPSSRWPGADGGHSSGARSPQHGPSGLGLGGLAAPHADRSRSELRGRSLPAPSGAAEEDRDSISGSVDLDRDDSFRTVFHLIWEFHIMAEPVSVAPNRCKISLALIYRL